LNHHLQCALTKALDIDMANVEMVSLHQWRAIGEQRCLES
jgi:hypothetical protein